MVAQEDPERTSQQGHTKITATYRATIYLNGLNTSRKDFSQLKTSRRNHNETGRRNGDAIQSGPTHLGGQPTNGKNITIIEVLYVKQGAQAPHWAPQPKGRAPPAPGK